MPQKTSPFLEGKWGWNFGEGGWNTGADENWLKFSYMFDRNVDGIVSSLPPAVNGQAYFNTTDNRFYFVVDGTYYSSPCPKWFVFVLRTTGEQYQFDGTSTNIVPSSAGIVSRLEAVELTLEDIQSVQGSTHIGTILPGTGSVGRTVADKLQDFISVKDKGAVGDGITDDTAAFQLAGAGAYVPKGVYLVNAEVVNVKEYFGPGTILHSGKLIPLVHPLLDGPIAQKLGGSPKFGWQPSGPDAGIYSGSGNATQGLTWVKHDGTEKIFITQRVSGSSWASDELVRISEWAWTGDGSEMTVVAFCAPIAIGHGSDLTALVEGGEIYLYTTATNNDIASAGGKGFTRIHWRGAATDQSDVELFKVFGEAGDGSRLTWPQRASVCATNDGKYIILVATSALGTGRFFFVYDRSEVIAAGVDARSVKPVIGPVPFERSPGEFGATLQGMTSDGEYLYTVWGAGPPRSAKSIQVYDMDGRLRRTIPYVGAGALYTETELMGTTARGIPVSFEPEGICLRGGNLLTLSIDAWKTPQDVVSDDGVNWASNNTTAASGIEPWRRSNWIITDLPAVSGAYNPLTPYIAGAYLRRDKRILEICLATGSVDELKIADGSTDATTGTIKEYYSGTDIAFNAENLSFTIAKFYEALGTYKKFAELNYENTLNLFSTASGTPNDRWVSMKSSWDSAMYGMQLRSSGGIAAGGANIDMHALDCPVAPGELTLSSTDAGGIRFRNGATTNLLLTSTGLVYYGSGLIRSTTNGAIDVGRSINYFKDAYFLRYFVGGSGQFITTGAASPEGSVTAPPGSLYMRTTGEQWLKTTGTGNTGWVLK